MKMAAGIAVTALAFALGACTAGHVHSTPTQPPSMHSTPVCDGTVAATPYANFAAALGTNQPALAATFFAGGGNFFWWDPSDPLGHVQKFDELADHFGHLYDLGVRLPTTLDLQILAGEAPGAGDFSWDDHRGFSGKGGVDCQTQKITSMVIDTWTTAIAGRAPITPPPPS